MRIKALKNFNHDQLGRVAKGQEVDISPEQLSGIRHLVEVYDTKVIHPEPVEPKKPETTSSSQAAQASPKKIAKKSKFGRRTKTEQ